MANAGSAELDDKGGGPGTVRLFRVGSISVFVHWSLPAAILLLAVPAAFGLKSALALCLAYACLVALHEFAHAAVARLLGLKVHALTISALGGECKHDTPKNYGSAFAIASAGLVAQLFLLIASQVYLNLAGWLPTRFGNIVLLVFIYGNGLLILANLVPEKRRNRSFSTDGYVLWKLATRKLKGQSFAYPDTSRTFSPDTRLARLQEFRPEGFAPGIEILNDNSTPMEFVVMALLKHLGMSKEEAVELMLSAHTKGGVIIPLPEARAQTVAAAIAHDAVAAGYPLVCRLAVPPDAPVASKT